MVTFGLDISHHQDLGLDLAQCKREGIEFVFIKSTEGSTFVDPEFGHNLVEAQHAGLLPAAYHYVKGNVTAAAQVANVQRVVPAGVPVIPDVEAGSGDIGMVRQVVAGLRWAGYVVPFSYIPRWYWQQLGQPSLAGLPPLWSSRYPDNVVGSLQDEWADVPATYWVGYGGLPVAVLQFTSSARIAGHQPLDANAFNGTRAQLAALLQGGEEKDMFEQADRDDLRAIAWRLDAALNMEDKVADHPSVPEGVRGQELELVARIKALESAVENLGTGGVDLDEVATKLAERLEPQLGPAIAKRVNDEIARRQAD